MNKITGYTGMYGIVANPIKHSFSPMMHNKSFEVLGIDDVYLAFEVKEENLKTFVESARILPIKGFNVSMPYKVKIMDYLDEISEEARLSQAVNTVKNVNGKLIGHISDGLGFYLACKNKNWDIENKKIVILGAGGAALAIIVELVKHHVKEIVVYNRSHKPYIQELSHKLNANITLKIFDEKELKEDLKDTYLLIQATSVGMIPNVDDCIIQSSTLMKHLKVADLIYKPKTTKLLQYCKELGIDCMNGEGMVVYQGAVSFEYWTNQKMPIEEVKKILEME